MQHIIIRVVAEDFDHWLPYHTSLAEVRREFGLSDGPVYRDTADPNAALVQLMTDDLPRAMGWFRDPRFKEATANAKVIGREFYVAEKR